MPEIGEGAWVASRMDDSVDDATEEPKKRRLKIRISLFFDGTSNNRQNTEARLAAKGQASELLTDADHDRERDKAIRAYKSHGEGKDNSYANDHSNVSRLENCVDHLPQAAAGFDYYFCHYIEGIGTLDLRRDRKVFGQGLGVAWTGMKAKVERGLEKAVAPLDKKIPKNAEVDVVVDTFGFSRGAAAARYCIYRALHDEDRFFSDLLGLKSAIEDTTSLTVNSVEVHAVGLWDTVASHVVDHTNDTPALKLAAVREAKAILQLAAAEEYRINFPLTNIASVDGGKGQQVYLPGAHSDVGGGYADAMLPNPRKPKEYGECKSIAEGPSSGAIAAFLLARGWYKPSELKHWTKSGLFRDKETVDVERPRISRQYSFIPLHIMADFAEEQGLPILPRVKSKYDPTLISSALRQRIESYAKQKLTSLPSDWEGNEPDLADLRNRFLHVSSATTIGMAMQTKMAGPGGKERPSREVFDG